MWLQHDKQVQNSIKEAIEEIRKLQPEDPCDPVGDEITANFVGYLEYGANGIVTSEEKGFFALYDAPTLDTEGERYNFSDLYDSYAEQGYDIPRVGALQSFVRSV